MEHINGCISVGLWGSQGARRWRYNAKGSITQITIASGEAIDSLQFKHVNEGGEVGFSKKFGGDGGKTETIEIDHPREYLTSISGTYGEHGGLLILTSLAFETNQDSYGPYGKDTGTYFLLPMEDNVICGFYGFAGHYIRSIGVNVKPKIKDTIAIKPWGDTDGQEWSYKVEGAITQIIIVSGEVINSIKFKGDNGLGVVSDSERFGGNSMGKSETIKINSPIEYLTSISGTMGDHGGVTLIRSLRFNTNTRSYGPFGKELGIDFSLKMEGDVIVGFHGSAGRNIKSIGLFVKPNTKEK